MQYLLDFGMATGPVLGYLHQYRLINITQSVGSFSIDICGILLFANILRLNFYIFNRYQTALFFQSVIMIIVQILLVHICTVYYNKNNLKSYNPKQTIQHSHTDTDIYQNKSIQNNFWRWNIFKPYITTILIFSLSTLSVSIFFSKLKIQSYGVMIGLVALLSQSVLILPQIIKNYLNKQTSGLSHLLLFLNLIGDIFKLIYFFMRVIIYFIFILNNINQTQPFQFIMCGIIQVCLDTFVILQVIYYNRLKTKQLQMSPKSKLNKSTLSKHTSHPMNDNIVNTQNQFNPGIQMKDIGQYNSPNNQNDQPTDLYGNSYQEEQQQTRENNQNNQNDINDNNNNIKNNNNNNIKNNNKNQSINQLQILKKQLSKISNDQQQWVQAQQVSQDKQAQIIMLHNHQQLSQQYNQIQQQQNTDRQTNQNIINTNSISPNKYQPNALKKNNSQNYHLYQSNKKQQQKQFIETTRSKSEDKVEFNY